MSVRHILALIVFTAGASACLNSEIVVTVRPDGSGTIERTAELRPAALTDLQKLIAPEPGAPPLRPPRAFLGRPDGGGPDLRGEGLRLLSSRSLSSATTLGWTALYEFDDVTRLTVDLLPRELGLDVFSGIGADRITNTRLTMTIETLTDGVERLTVHFPRFALDPSIEPPAGWVSGGSASEMAALRNVLKGSHLGVVIRTERPLLRTNSPHRDGDRVTLLDVDVEQALFSRQIGMLASTPASFDELLWAFGDLPGVTLAREHDVTLDLQGLQAPAPAVQAPPDTEIFLAPLTTAAGKVTVGLPVNISNSPGYDNQPSFTPDGREILFSSARRAPAATDGPTVAGSTPAAQTDIYRYDIAAKRISRVTRTPESEYSPTVMPDGTHISVVRVEADGTQRLWSFTRDGENPAVVLASIKPVGYHAWIDARTLALFVLGQSGQPATLQIADTQSGTAEVAAVGIGRSLQRMPSGAMSFVQREAGAAGAPPSLAIKRLDNSRAPFAASSLTRPVPGATDPDLAWMADGTLLMAQGGTLYRWRSAEPEWTPIADLDALGLRNVTRLAVSPRSDRLAIVAQPK